LSQQRISIQPEHDHKRNKLKSFSPRLSNLTTQASLSNSPTQLLSSLFLLYCSQSSPRHEISGNDEASGVNTSTKEDQRGENSSYHATQAQEVEGTR